MRRAASPLIIHLAVALITSTTRLKPTTATQNVEFSTLPSESSFAPLATSTRRSLSSASENADDAKAADVVYLETSAENDIVDGISKLQLSATNDLGYSNSSTAHYDDGLITAESTGYQKTSPSSGDPVREILKSFFSGKELVTSTPRYSSTRGRSPAARVARSSTPTAPQRAANARHEFLLDVEASEDVLELSRRRSADRVFSGEAAETTDCSVKSQRRLDDAILSECSVMPVDQNISAWLSLNASIANASSGDASAALTAEYVASVVAIGVVLGAICLATVVGNALVLVAIGSNGHLRGTTHYFIANLAVADLLLGVTVLPFSAALETTDRWLFGQSFCDVWAAMDVLCCTASILSLCVISVDRYIGVTRPLRHSVIFSERRAGWVIVGVWLMSLAISVAPLFGWKESRQPGSDPGVCEVTKQTGYVLFSVAGSFYIPLSVILVVYYRVYREAVRQSQFLAKGIKTADPGDSSGSTAEVTLRIHIGRHATGAAGGATGSCASSRKGSMVPGAVSAVADDQRPGVAAAHVRVTVAGRIAKFKREKKAAKTLGIVVGVFVLCWFPFFFILPLEALCTECHVPAWLFKIMFWLGYCNSMMNPIIYTCASRDFKRAFLRILRCRHCCDRCPAPRPQRHAADDSTAAAGARHRPYDTLAGSSSTAATATGPPSFQRPTEDNAAASTYVSANFRLL